tara:strand:- start:86 stop:271 length:186 start_codon:yes stop_codon:yes gene_type:complete
MFKQPPKSSQKLKDRCNDRFGSNDDIPSKTWIVLSYLVYEDYFSVNVPPIIPDMTPGKAMS